MIFTEAIDKALLLCYKAFEGKIDENGMPLFFRSIFYVDTGWKEETVVVALLYDLTENAGYTMKDFDTMGFSKAITNALELLIYDKDIPYFDYIKKISENPYARAVKCDYFDEVIGRLQYEKRTNKKMPKEKKDMLDKYNKAHDYLLECEAKADADGYIDTIINKVTFFPDDDMEEQACRFVIKVYNEILERFDDISFYQTALAIRQWKLWQKTVSEPELIRHYGVSKIAEEIYNDYQKEEYY